MLRPIFQPAPINIATTPDLNSAGYNIKMLVYAEQHEQIVDAIAREKAIKAWRRQWKIDLIESINPDWRDLFDDLA